MWWRYLKIPNGKAFLKSPTMSCPSCSWRLRPCFVPSPSPAKPTVLSMWPGSWARALLTSSHRPGKEVKGEYHPPYTTFSCSQKTKWYNLHTTENNTWGDFIYLYILKSHTDRKLCLYPDLYSTLSLIGPLLCSETDGWRPRDHVQLSNSLWFFPRILTGIRSKKKKLPYLWEKWLSVALIILCQVEAQKGFPWRIHSDFWKSVLFSLYLHPDYQSGLKFRSLVLYYCCCSKC